MDILVGAMRRSSMAVVISVSTCCGSSKYGWIAYPFGPAGQRRFRESPGVLTYIGVTAVGTFVRLLAG
jgi:hypothetical protein